ncbi:hypothetical protein ACI1UM_10635 [Lactococcus petauri]|uniref:hypothetical protein n=1 Tax=Lactococcus petauri TaxID=1940789 RepID=UPI0038552CB9
MGYYKVEATNRTVTKVIEFTAEQYKLATSKESIAMSKALGGENVSHFVASPSTAPEYIRAAIREHEAGKE